MPNTKNKQEVEDLIAKLSSSQAVYLADYAGLTVKAQQELRRKVVDAGGELRVTKNTLLKIAFENRGLDTKSIGDALTGPNMTLFANSDPIAPLKVLVDFAKDNEKPVMKAGFLGKDQLSSSKIMELAKLPSKLELLSRLVGTLQAPVRNLASVLAAPTRNLVYALNAIKGNKSKSN